MKTSSRTRSMKTDSQRFDAKRSANAKAETQRRKAIRAAKRGTGR